MENDNINIVLLYSQQMERMFLLIVKESSVAKELLMQRRQSKASLRRQPAAGCAFSASRFLDRLSTMPGLVIA